MVYSSVITCNGGAMKGRKIILKVHLYLAAFFAPMVIIMALSGGLYLLGIKGNTTYNKVALLPDAKLDAESPGIKQELSALLQQANIDFEFEYVKVKGKHFFTRPTSRVHYRLHQSGKGVVIHQGIPDWQATLMELHKGHGPTWYKRFETLFALALMLVMVSGLILGLQSPLFKGRTLVLSGVGTAVFLLLVIA